MVLVVVVVVGGGGMLQLLPLKDYNIRAHKGTLERSQGADSLEAFGLILDLDVILIGVLCVSLSLLIRVNKFYICCFLKTTLL